MRNNALLVEIFVDTGGGKGELATGYPVGKDRVITARHAVFPQDKTVHGIELRWYHQKDEAGQWIQLDVADCVAWDGGEAFDVALLKCPFPIAGSGRLSRRKPMLGMQWESEGFARVGQRGNSRPPTKLWGRMPSAGNADTATFVLGAESPPELEAHWQGASGSPVFVDDEIIGIIESCTDHFNAARLRATPVWKLREIPEFVQAICEGIDAQEERRKRLEWARGKIIPLLKNATQVMTQLRDHLDPGNELGEEPKEITSLMLEKHPLSELLDLLNMMRITFQEQEQSNSANLECVRKLLNILLPALFDHHLSAWLRNQKGSFAALTLTPQIATESVAEIIMAGSDDRLVVFKPLQNRKELPTGAYNRHKSLPLPGMIESGISDKDTYIRDFHKHMIEDFAVLSLGSGEPTTFLIEQAAARIEHFATKKYDKQTRYCTYKLPKHNDEQAVFIQVVEELQVKYPHLVFIKLDTDEQRYLEEARQMFPVADMLEVAEHAPNTEDPS